MKNKCVNCGAELPKGASFCGVCGQQNAVENRSRGFSGGTVAVLILIAILVTAVTVFTLTSVLNKPEPSLRIEISQTEPAPEPLRYNLSPENSQADEIYQETFQSGYLPTKAQENTSKVKAGDVISMGMFDMDSDPDKEKIWWRVLDVQSNMALIITRDGIDCRRFQSQDGAVTWGDSELRRWLNEDFYMNAFSMEEYNRITVSRVQYFDHKLDTYEIGDRVFLLSLGEALSYFEDSDDRICHPSELAVNKGAYVNPDTDGSWWWLRDSGDSASKIASINSDGAIDFDGGSAKSGAGVVRPAMWVFVG